MWWNGNHGVRVLEDDAIIKNNNIRNNTLDGVNCAGGSDLFIENNTIVDNGDDGIELGDECSSVLIKVMTLKRIVIEEYMFQHQQLTMVLLKVIL